MHKKIILATTAQLLVLEGLQFDKKRKVNRRNGFNLSS